MARSDLERIWSVVARIPRGRVATYGLIAALAGLPRRARLVGHALRVVDDSRPIPWHRVVNAAGEISARGDPEFEQIQRKLLEKEGVAFGANGRIALKRWLWKPKG